MKRPTAILACAFALASGCSQRPQPEPPRSSPPAATTTPTSLSPSATSTPTPSVSEAAAHVALRHVATLNSPLAMAVRRGDPNLYFANQAGTVVAVRNGRVRSEVLDLSNEISFGGEQGLLGLAFSPDGRFLYVNYTDVEGDTRVVEYAFSGRPLAVRDGRLILRVDQPFANHNGGHLVFGPDGMLYIGLGDGGSGGDPFDNGQSLDTLLGKMLRIDPRPTAGRPYGVPRDNPFVGRPDVRPEIWSYGLRNPWRYSFDRETGDLWIGDVGQSGWEEVDFEPAGSRGGVNYGWNRFEGRHRFFGRPPKDTVFPIYEYEHTGDVCVVTGGHVYRGDAVPELRGLYVFADFCDGELQVLLRRGAKIADTGSLRLVVPNVSSFAEDAQGELYALSLSGDVFRLVRR